MSPSIYELLAQERDAILSAAQRRRAFNVRIFGSVARGEAGPDSDIDFLVQFHDDATLWDQVGLWQDLQQLLGRKVDVASVNTLKAALRDDILKDAVAL